MYPLANSSLTPLAPVNSVTKHILALACVIKADGTPLDVAVDFKKEDARPVTYVEYARSRTQVDDALSTKIAASFSSPFASASAEIEATSEARVRGDSLYLVGELFASVKHVLLETCPLTLTENATDLLLDDSAFGTIADADRARYRAAAFMRVCGDGWTHTRLMGAGGSLILEWKAKFSSAKNAIRSELSASFGIPVLGAKIGTSIASSKSKLQSDATLKTTLVTRGSIAGMPTPGDIDEDPTKLTAMVGKLEELAKKLGEAGGDVSNMSPMAARLAAYNGLPPWKGWGEYDDDDQAKIRASLALIKPLAEEMEKFLALRAALVKELETIKAQIVTIRDVYPNYFNYDGKTQWNFAGTKILPVFGLTPNYDDVALYNPRLDTLIARLRAEMQACVDSGNDGYSKCKPAFALPKLVVRDIEKWRTNRPKMIAAWQAPFSSSAADAAVKCKTYDNLDGRVVLESETKYLRTYANGHLWPTDGHRIFWIGDPVRGEKCGEQVAHSYYRDATDDKTAAVCGHPWSLGTICMPKGATSMWDEQYWKDELALGSLGIP
jgi:hypothetical protein